ncbi:MAG TPA: hypothetical protein VN026_11685 [Bacteroidia bacterium]|jgi:hypothetical protein|nr:hypothetical protein [Bacteroidia bacterium]
MKTKQLILTLGTIVLAGSLVLTSCKKKTQTEDPADTDQSEASDHTLAENTTNDIAGIGSQGSENGSLSTYRMGGSDDMFLSSCAAITTNTTSKTFTVDFGTTPCLCMDGKMRSGKLMFDYSASTSGAVAYRMPGYKFSASSSNYVVDGYTVNIVNKTVENITPLASVSPSLVPGTNLTWSITANVNIIKPSGGGTISWNCTRTKTLLNTSDPLCYHGQSIPITWSKAKIQLDGSASGTTAQGNSYTSTIIALVRDFGGCTLPGGRHPFISGDIQFTPGTKATRYINFGSGTCDAVGTITIKGITYTFNF